MWGYGYSKSLRRKQSKTGSFCLLQSALGFNASISTELFNWKLLLQRYTARAGEDSWHMPTHEQLSCFECSIPELLCNRPVKEEREIPVAVIWNCSICSHWALKIMFSWLGSWETGQTTLQRPGGTVLSDCKNQCDKKKSWPQRNCPSP